MSLSKQYEPGPNDVAVVGLGLRVPGADTPEAFWRNLRDGVESVRTFTDEELIAAGVTPEERADPNYVRAGMVLENLEMFDADFFGLSAQEAAVIDPQHRHFLECAWEALERAGHPPQKFAGRIGVFAGCGMGSYFTRNLLGNPELVRSLGPSSLRHTGSNQGSLAGRVSYCLDLRGPSVGIQTACSTSLVAVHAACRSLLSGECDMALAGGSTIELPHRRGYLYKKHEILSPDGRCRAFDHRAQGTIFGSGAGVVALRRLDDALRDGDPIVAVIKGSAVNNDGAGKVGYFAPCVDGQAAAAAAALAMADVPADTVRYVECHGTGTPDGDPIEIAALSQAFRKTSTARGYCRIGSVKTNIGHLDTAAGVVGLAKAALALQYQQFPPSLHFQAPNPAIDFESGPFVVNAELAPWPAAAASRPDGAATPRRASVNSLGIGGTNAHAVLEEAPVPAPSSDSQRPYQLYALSARNREALDDASRRLAAHLVEHPELAPADVAYTLWEGRHAFAQRRVVAARDNAEAAALLTSGDTQRVFTHKAADVAPSVVFLLPGGGAQYPRMGRDLYEAEPVFREWIDRGLAALAGKLDVNLRELWFAPPELDAENEPHWRRPSIQLPAVYLCEYALAQLWMSWGVRPAALVGHSLGENTAAALAGVFSFDDGLGLVTLRGRLFERLPAGGMLGIPLSPEVVRPLLGDRLDLAIINAPEMCTASGPVEALDELLAKLTEQGVEAKRVPINIAAHSRLLEPILAEFEAYLRRIVLRKPTIPIAANRTGGMLSDASATDPKYWVEHLRNTVRFADCLSTVLSTPNRLLLEVGPGKTLSSLARQHPLATAEQTIVSSLRHPNEPIADAAWFTSLLGRLWAAGLPIDGSNFWRGETRRRVVLPTYAFQRKRHWIEPSPASAASVSLTPERIENIDDWHFRPVWKLTEAVGADEPLAEIAVERATWLVFLDDAGLGERLVAQFRRDGHHVSTVRPGDAYAAHDAQTYTLSPEHGRDGYDALVRDLAAAGRLPTRILHLWLVTPDQTFRPGSNFFHRNQEQGFYSLLFLAQALAAECPPQPVRWTVVVNGMQQVRHEQLEFPEKATLLGPVGVIPREFAGHTAAAVDIRLPQAKRSLLGARQPATAALDHLAGQIWLELAQPAANEQIALRGDRRYVLKVERNAGPRHDKTGDRLRKRGTYLITGGLGGIGLAVAEHLAATVKARLVITGRAPLPPAAEWDGWLRSHDDRNAVSLRIRRIRELESYGAEVLAIDADVTDIDAMRQALADARELFGPIHGVVHAAGVLADNLISLKTQAEIEEVFSPKVQGTLVLDGLLADHPLDFFVVCSSVCTLTAPAGQVDYVAANAFLNAYAHSRRRPDRFVAAVNWGVWNDVGMAARALDKRASHESPAEHPTLHPWFDYRQGNVHDRQVRLVGRHAVATHWVYEEHRTAAGRALLPAAGYLELARAALAELGENGPLRFTDIFLLSPLALDDEEERDVVVRLLRDEQGYALTVESRIRTPDGWIGRQVHADGRIVPADLPSPAQLDLDAVDARCPRLRLHDDYGRLRTRQEDHLRFGPRWRVLRSTAYGDGQALATLALPPTASADALDTDESFPLHPALFDMATGFAMNLIDGYEQSVGLWVPVSYGEVRYYAPLTPVVRSWVRRRGRATAAGDTAAFDVTICDELGRVLVEIENFSIRRVPVAGSFASDETPARPDFDELISPDYSARDDEPASPAEAAFRANVKNGIRPAEGAAALVEALNRGRSGAVIVSSMDVAALRRAADAAVLTAPAEGEAKFERPRLDGNHVPPRDNIERQLAALWEELLGVRGVGVRDGFFELGGRSLIAVRLYARIKRTFHVDFSISVLFESPTIERVADLVRAEIGGDAFAREAAGSVAPAPSPVHAHNSSKPRYAHLVTMHDGAGNERPPLFVVAGMFGNVLNLRHLAHLVGADRPCYGLQARGLYGDAPPHETFEAAAADYLAEMRHVQPHGPYVLAGFSGGGIAAYEIARQLELAGEDVAFLGLLDTLPVGDTSLSFGDRCLIHLQRIARERHRYPINFLAGQMARLWNDGKRRLAGEAPPPPADRFHSALIESAFRRACACYQTPSLDRVIALFRPKLRPAHVLGPDRMIDADGRFIYHDNGWSRFVRKVEVSEVPGDHDSMVLEPNVRVLAAKLRKSIAAAEAAHDRKRHPKIEPETPTPAMYG